jgi:hypothetical protein
MITIHLDGKRMEVSQGSTLGSILSGHPPECCAAIIRPITQEQAKTGSVIVSTTAGEVTVELGGRMPQFWNHRKLQDNWHSTGGTGTQQLSGRSRPPSDPTVNHICTNAVT